MRHSTIPLRALAAAAFALVAACSDSTGPRAGLPSASEAMKQMQRGFVDDTANSYGARATVLPIGMIGLYLGSSVAPLTVSLDGRSGTFSSVSFAETNKDSVDTNFDGVYDAIGLDSAAITIAWRGASAEEVVYVAHYGGANAVAAPAAARRTLDRLAHDRNPVLARAAARLLGSRAARVSGVGYAFSEAAYLTRDDGYYMVAEPSAATGALTVGATPCSTRTSLGNSTTQLLWPGYDTGDTCTEASLTTGISAMLGSDIHPSAPTRQIEVPVQTLPAIRLYIDWTNDPRPF